MTDDPARDPAHWLHRFSPREWMSAALAELSKAVGAYGANDARGGLAGARRAAGMALNAALAAAPNEGWGRTYMDHLAAIARDGAAPEAVRHAAATLLEVRPPGHSVIGLRSKSGDERVIEAARDVMAHAYTLMARAEASARLQGQLVSTSCAFALRSPAARPSRRGSIRGSDRDRGSSV